MNNGSCRFSDEEIDEFKAILEKEYGETLTDKDAIEHAEKLLSLMKIIIKH